MIILIDMLDNSMNDIDYIYIIVYVIMDYSIYHRV